jgi:hypothetical protein
MVFACHLRLEDGGLKFACVLRGGFERPSLRVVID